MQGNYIVLDTQKFYDKSALFKGRKPAKLSTFSIFKKNAVAKQNSIKSSVENKVEKEETAKVEVQQPASVPQAPVAPPKVEPKKEEINNVITLPSKEVLDKKSNNLNVSFYKNLPGEVVKLVSYRRLRVNSLIVAILNHVKNVAAVLNEIKVEVKEQFDFSQFQNVNVQSPTPVFEEAPREDFNRIPDNNQLLEKYLNKENIDMANSAVDEAYIVEINSLTREKENTEDSLATQKEILANLKRRIEQNKALCEAKKRELMEENMALTQELNDVLSEINQLSDIASQQEAFLGINTQDDNSYGRR